MSSLFESEQDKVIPLSHAHVTRRENARIETSVIELEEMLTTKSFKLDSKVLYINILRKH